MKLISENPKTSLTTAVGALIVVVVFVLAQFGVEVPLEVSAAAGVVIVFLLGRFTRLSKTEAEKLEEL